MHPNPAFELVDPATLSAIARDIGFGTVTGIASDGLRVAHVPFALFGPNQVRFHLARNNALTEVLDGSKALLVATGPNAYVSPDWYGMDNQVPTWNYLAVEAEGDVRRMSEPELVTLVDTLSTAQEQRLQPKPIWTRQKMTDGAFENLLRGIVGFELAVRSWRGTAKFSQNKPKEARANLAHIFDEAGNHAVAALTRNPPA